MRHVFMEGNEAVAWGALAAGCRFFAGYPITPATTVYNTMLKILPPAGGICIQGEDEIASMGYCIGASMAGQKVLTATSGPGISLYSEQISFAIGSEIPMVIVDVQRLGPSTGSATRGADGDIEFLQWGSSGGLPVIVLAPTDVSDCFTLTMHAFNLAETYRCPVFIASNKEIAMTRESVDMDALIRPEIVDRKEAALGAPFLPFSTTGTETVPAFLPLGHRVLVRQTSSTHGVDGYITTDPKAIADNQKRLMKKIQGAVEAFTHYDVAHEPGAGTLLITYGVTSRAARCAATRLKAAKKPISVLVLKTLWPIPETFIQAASAPYARIVVVEMNMGQYVREIQRVLCGHRVDFFGQMNGKLITPEQIEEVIGHE